MPSRYPGNLSQDWDPVVLNRRQPKAADLRDPKTVNQALRSGATVQIVKKHDGGLNKKTSTAGPVVYARKLDEHTEPASLERLSAEVRQAIQKAHIDKKMSQADLAKLICETPPVVQEYESVEAVLAKMERILEVKLRSKIK